MSHSRRFDPAKLAKLDSPERRARMPHAAIVAALELEPHARIAAVAAGTGYVTFALLDGEVPPAIIHTIDVSGPMLGGAHATGQRVPLD